MIWFTSDLHFGHENVIKYNDRPFSGGKEMNEVLIANWNAMVKPQDDIYILGDLTLRGPQYVNPLLRRLNGRKYLICGNHDIFVRKASFDRDQFVWIQTYHELNVCNYWFILFHYPIERWNGCLRKENGILQGSIHLHGHQHNRPSYNEENRRQGVRRYDVGVDANAMHPVSIEKILSFFDLRT